MICYYITNQRIKSKRPSVSVFMRGIMSVYSEMGYTSAEVDILGIAFKLSK